MDYIYELVEIEYGSTLVKRTDADGNESWIPIDPANSDYAAYLESLETPATKAK